MIALLGAFAFSVTWTRLSFIFALTATCRLPGAFVRSLAVFVFGHNSHLMKALLVALQTLALRSRLVASSVPSAG
jgi:hypothetical protein